MHKLKSCPACGRPRTKKWLIQQERLRVFRIKEAHQKAKAYGMKLGRPRKIDYQKVRELRKECFSMSQIAKELGCATSTVFEALKAR